MTLELAKCALEVASPEEVALIDAFGLDLIAGAGLSARRDGSLGFGGLEVMTSTAMGILTSKAVVDSLPQIAQKFAVERGVGLLKRLADRLKGRPAEGEP